jgi:hypothetical protein
MTFRFAGARAQVCKHCNFVVARTDRGLQAVGRVADLVDIPSPFQVGATGRWANEPFMVDGRVQLDRVNAPGAPWQEIFITFPQSGRWVWIANAQGRWYSTTEVPLPSSGAPPVHALRAGMQLQLAEHGVWQVAEVGQRRVVSGEGEMPNVAAPGAPTGYADIAAPGGRFGTIDYGQGGAPPTLYLGQQIDPAVLQLDSGAPVQAAEAEATTLACPNCGGNLPLIAPGTAERIICKYCGTASDVKEGALSVLGPSPRPPMEPYIPLGAEGNLRGMRVICIGFVIRGCTVEGERYRWREYLLYAGASVGYVWLMEEDGAWQLVTPISPGDVQVSGSMAQYRGAGYSLKQSVEAQVEYVIGEFYWKVEIGENVRATEYQGPGGKVSVEWSPTEVQNSFCAPLPGPELAQAFGLQPPPRAYGASSGAGVLSGSMGTYVLIAVIIFFFIACSLMDCDGGSGGGGAGVFIGSGGK